jgi:peptidoglycan/xylan/chitin deacetylase (PgdA/CDA1 family)
MKWLGNFPDPSPSEDGPRVALTFDAEAADGPDHSPDGGLGILDALSNDGVRATFFVQAGWALANPALARRIADDGHLVGSHSTAHVRSTLLSDAELRANVLEAGETIATVTGVDPAPWFRCPCGDGHDAPRVLGVLAGAGYRNVHWDVDPEDWAPSRESFEVVRAVVDGATSRARAIVLLHSWPRATAEAVPVVLRELMGAGASFVTVDELEAPA